MAIIMNVKKNRVAILQNDPLKLWKNIISQNGLNDFIKRDKNFNKILETDILNIKSNIKKDYNIYQSSEIDLSIVNYWAFKNHIPISGHFELTDRCNLRCKHCYCLFTKKKDSLSTENIFKVIDNLKKAGTLGLVLTGGEIFFRKDIVEILNYLYKKKFVLRLNSNGTYIDENIIKKIENFSNIYRFHISLYGSNSEIHDKITQVKGSFDKTLKAINLLKEAGFNIRINCSVMNSNFNNYQKIKSLIGDPLKIPVHFDSVIFPKDDGSEENLEEQIGREKFENFWSYKNSFIDKKVKTGDKDKKPKLCKAGFSFFSICEDGTVYPCLKMKRYFKNPLGDLKKDSFIDIWKTSREIENIRDSLSDKLRECDICDLTI